DPLLRVGDGERVQGLDEEPIEEQERGDRGEDRRAAAEGDGAGEHRREVEDRDVGGGGAAGGDADGGGGERDRGEWREGPHPFGGEDRPPAIAHGYLTRW